MSRPLLSIIVVAAFLCTPARADDAVARPTPTKHQLMKDCMAKQKASDGGMPKEDMKKNCRDLTETEHENAQAEKATEESPKK